MYDITTNAAGEFWPSRDFVSPPYFNYRLEQVRQVERDAIRIWSVESGDLEVLLAAVWVHDRFIPQFYGANHAIKAAKWALSSLVDTGFPQRKVEAVAQAVALHDRKTMDIPRTLREARILWDATHVSKLGPTSTLCYIFSHTSNEFLDMLPDSPEYPEDALTLIDFAPNLLERRPQLYKGDYYYFDQARKMARQRIHVMRDFVDTLESQLWLSETEDIPL